MENLTENDLWTLVQNDNLKAFGLLYDRLWDKLYKTIYWHIYSQDDTEDILQDLFVQLWEKRHQINITENVQGYLKVTARSKVLNFIKAKNTRGKYNELAGNEKPEFANITSDYLDERELRRLYDSEIDKLPEKMKEIFLFSRKDGLTNEQIAKELSLSQQTVKNQISSALKKIRIAIEQHLYMIIIGLIIILLFFIKTYSTMATPQMSLIYESHLWRPFLNLKF